jgi:hypothetical protein
MLKLGDGVGAIARVAIWTGINIDWSKRTGRLPRDFRRLARVRARILNFAVGLEYSIGVRTATLSPSSINKPKALPPPPRLRGMASLR